MHTREPALQTPVWHSGPMVAATEPTFFFRAWTPLGAVESQALVTECVSYTGEPGLPPRAGIGGGGNENCHDYTCVCFHCRVNLRDKLWFGTSCSKHANQDCNHVPHRFRVWNTVGYANLQDKEWMMATFGAGIVLLARCRGWLALITEAPIVVWAVVAGLLHGAKGASCGMAAKALPRHLSLCNPFGPGRPCGLCLTAKGAPGDSRIYPPGSGLH